MNTRSETPEIGLLGAGIIGLTAGLRLLAQGWRVVIYARAITPHTTSDLAAALWFPYQVAPMERVKKWAAGFTLAWACADEVVELAQEWAASGDAS